MKTKNRSFSDCSEKMINSGNIAETVGLGYRLRIVVLFTDTASGTLKSHEYTTQMRVVHKR